MKNSKGFTLIELLAVIVVLAIILIIAIPTIGNIIRNTKENSLKSDIKLMENSARTYVNKTGEYVPKESESEILPLKTLINKNYISKIMYPDNSNTECDGAVLITNTNGKYVYEGYLNCGLYLSDNIDEIYKKLDKIVEERTIQALKEDNNLLPEENNTVTIAINNLDLNITDFMDPDNNIVSGNVIVNNGTKITNKGTIATINGGTYEVISNIIVRDENNNDIYVDGEVLKVSNNSDDEDLNDEPTITYLKDKFLENVGTSGTYELKNEGTSNEAYFFVGANPNNWIQFGKDSNENDLIWRIIKNNDEGIKIIYEGIKNGSSAPTDNGRVTLSGSLTASWDSLNNKWERPADLKTKLATWYNSLSLNSDAINPINWCLGASGQGINYATVQVPTSHFLSTECIDGTYNAGGTFLGQTTDKTGYGLIRVSDYISASSADTCTGSYFDGTGSDTVDRGRQCGRIVNEAGRTNYLWKSAYTWWTYTARGTFTNYVWGISLAGSVNSIIISDTASSVRPILNLKSDIQYNDGNGTLETPYIIE